MPNLRRIGGTFLDRFANEMEGSTPAKLIRVGIILGFSVALTIFFPFAAAVTKQSTLALWAISYGIMVLNWISAMRGSNKYFKKYMNEMEENSNLRIQIMELQMNQAQATGDQLMAMLNQPTFDNSEEDLPDPDECGDPISGIGCSVPGCTHEPEDDFPWPEGTVTHD